MSKLPNSWQRANEGWILGPVGGIPYAMITRTPFGREKFPSDEAAHEFVIDRAREGSQYHIDCLTYIAKQRLKGR